MHQSNVDLDWTKTHTDRLLQWLRGRGRVLIVVHDNPDPDSLASAMALRHLLVMKLDMDPVIAFSGIIARSENLAMAEKLEIQLSPWNILDLNAFQVTCMLDTQPGAGNNSVLSTQKVDVVIDHHPLIGRSGSHRWVDVRPEYGATATILYEYLIAQDTPPGLKVATALFYAIKSETQDLGREANKADREAYISLFHLANKRLIYEITHPRLPREYFTVLTAAINGAVIEGTVISSHIQRIDFPEIVAEMADLLVRLEKIETALCTGRYGQDLIISLRTVRSDLNMGHAAKTIVEGLGSAGGHGMMAGGKITIASADAWSTVEEIVRLRLLQELGISGSGAQRLIPLH